MLQHAGFNVSRAGPMSSSLQWVHPECAGCRLLVAELDRLRQEVHAFHVELAALQTQLIEKDGLLQQALSDAAALDCKCSAAGMP